MTLVETIREVAGFAEKDSPIWNNVYFGDGQVMAQHPGLGMLAPTPFKLNCAVDAGILMRALRSLVPSDSIDIKLDKNILQIKAGSTRASLPAVNGADIPKFETPAGGAKWVEFGLEAASRVRWCVCADISRTNLSGVYIGAAGIQATDGHGLMLFKGDFLKKLGWTTDMILPPDGFKGLPDKVWLHRSGEHLFMAYDAKGTQFRVLRAIEGTFPDTSRYMGDSAKKPRVKVSRVELLDTCKRAAQSGDLGALEFKGKKLHVVTTGDMKDNLFSFMDGVEIEGNSDTQSKAKVGIGIAHLMIPALESMAAEIIQISVQGPNDPVVMWDDDIGGLALLMPTTLTG